MIVVDSSVWIALLRGLDSQPVRKLRALEHKDEILVGDLILLDVLQGARNDTQAAHIERDLRQFTSPCSTTSLRSAPHNTIAGCAREA